jgi:hypothetical protein
MSLVEHAPGRGKRNPGAKSRWKGAPVVDPNALTFRLPAAIAFSGISRSGIYTRLCDGRLIARKDGKSFVDRCGKPPAMRRRSAFGSIRHEEARIEPAGPMNAGPAGECIIRAWGRPSVARARLERQRRGRFQQRNRPMPRSNLALNPADRDKLARILGMTGSLHDGEALNAARLADRLVREQGITWFDVLHLPTRQQHRQIDVLIAWPERWQAAARLVARAGARRVREKDLAFAKTVGGYVHRPSAKQLLYLLDLTRRVLAAGNVP